MPKTVRTHTAIVVDRSGSMAENDMSTEADSSIRVFIQKLRDLPSHVKGTVSLYQFDTLFEPVYGPVKPADAPDYHCAPRGATALYDAVALTILQTRITLQALDKKPDKVALVIMTDGKENASHEHSFNGQQALIAEAKLAGWEVTFLAGTPQAVDYGKWSGLKTTAYRGGVRGQTMSAYEASSAAVADFYTGQTESVETPDSVIEEEK